ncbi:MAG: tetratricopeptide repeat protein [Ignavibacteriales bacterium]|nr:MAG: tetratricopeptide repeat protein [Ignavibacteriales bacterium]
MMKTQKKKTVWINRKDVTRIFPLIIIVWAILVYSNSFDASFQLDDNHTIITNEHIDDPSYYLGLNRFLTVTNGRTLASLTYCLNYWLGKMDVTGYHIFNLLVHIISGLIIFRLSGIITQSLSLTGNKARIIPLFAALIFVSHPVQVEAVTYITQRMASMAALFYMGGITVYLTGRLNHGKKKIYFTILMYALSIIFFFLSMWSKENAVTYPLAILLVEIYFVRNNENRLNKRFIFSYVIILLLMASYRFISTGLPVVHSETSRLDYFFTELRVIITYIRLLFIPFNQQVFYDYPVSKSFFEWPVMLSSFLIILILCAAVFLYKRNKILSFGIIWFFLTIAAESSFIPIKYFICEYRLYLPMFGYALFLSTMIGYLTDSIKFSKYAIGFIVLYILFLSVSTYKRNFTWQDPVTLWSDNLKKAPNHPVVHFNLGYYYVTSGKNIAALNVLDRSIQIDPKYAEAYCHRGMALFQLGKYDDALRDFSSAIKYNPDLFLAYYNRAAIFYTKKEFRKSIDAFREAFKYNKLSHQSYYNIGNSYYMLVDLDSAIINYNICIKMKPEFKDAYFHRGLAYYFKKDSYNTALPDFLYCAENSNNQAEAYHYAAICYRELGKPDSAIIFHNKCLEITPDFFNGVFERIKTLITINRKDLALSDINELLKSEPNNSVLINMKAEILSSGK